MQLLAFHQILVGAAIALAVLFGLRSAVLFSHGGKVADLLLAVVSLAVAGALGLYLRKVRARVAELKREKA
jgi:hypothetical protein